MGLLSKINRSSKERGRSSAAAEEAIVVSVPDIKQYLVDEMERNKDLSLEIEGLRQKAEEQTELQNKYNAALVALDEYKRRISVLERDQEFANKQRLEAFNERRKIESERNTYKIKCERMEREEAQRLQDARRDEREKLIEAMVAGIESSKGNLSKDRVCLFIQRYADAGENISAGKEMVKGK